MAPLSHYLLWFDRILDKKRGVSKEKKGIWILLFLIAAVNVEIVFVFQMAKDIGLRFGLFGDLEHAFLEGLAKVWNETWVCGIRDP